MELIGGASNAQMIPVTFIEFFGLLRRKKLNKYKQSSSHVICQWKCQAEPPWSCIMYSYLSFFVLSPGDSQGQCLVRPFLSLKIMMGRHSEQPALTRWESPHGQRALAAPRSRFEEAAVCSERKLCFKSMATVAGSWVGFNYVIMPLPYSFL